MLVSMRRFAAAVLLLQATLILVRGATTDEKTTDKPTTLLPANKGFGSDSDEAKLDTDVESTVPPARASMRPAPLGGVVARAGEDALLTCVVTGARGQDVAWRRARDSRQLTSGHSRVTDDDRIFVLHDDSDEPAKGAVGIPRGGDVWALVVRDVRPADSGLYVCELRVPHTPPLRTFHKLTIISRGLTPPESANGTSDSYSANASPVSPLARAHNYTSCCVAANVTRACLGFCSIQTILEGSTGQDPENCERDFPNIVKCMADGRNHVPCCIQEHVPDICRDVCRGEYTAITDNIKTHFSCAAYTEQTLACIVEGIAILPSAPETVEVEPLNEKQLKISWSLPIAKAETITQYLINVTTLRSFDAHLIDPSESSVRNASDAVNAMKRLIKVPAVANSTVLNDLLPFTMYEITVTSLNIHGSSLPSYAVRSLTMTPSTGRLSPWGAASAPRLPDIQQCCLDANVTHRSCLRKLCDPVNTFQIGVPDLMICAPWAGATFRCLANGRDHSPCCRARGLPNACLPLCTGNVTTIDFNYFKCLRYMSSYTNCLLSGYGVLAGAPSRLHVTNIGEDYAVSLWSPPAALADTVTHYNLHYRRSPDQDDDAHDDYTLIDKITDTRYILEDLDSNTDYEVYVEAVNEHGVGEPSSRIIFRTQSELIEDEIEDAMTYNMSACCSRASVAGVCLPLCSYDASMSDLRTLAALCTHDFHKLLRCGAGGRNHESCCARRGVAAACRPLCGGVMVGSLLATANSCVPYIGNIVQCFEEGAGLLPGPPREVHAVRISDDAVWLQWTASDDGPNATHYVVHYQRLANTTAAAPHYYNTLQLDNQLNASDTFASITKLETHALYHMFVVSVNEHGTSLPSSILVLNITQVSGPSHISGVASPPHSLGVSGHSATWVAISWQPPQFSLADEKIIYTLHHKTPGEDELTRVNTTVPSHTLEKLTPNTQYIVFVTATTQAGTSAASETLVAWTDPAYPAFVEPPTVHPVNLVVEGSSMTILCIAMGTPMPTISLYISGRLVRQESTRHMVTVISNVTRDMDQIACYADNGYGTPMQASRKITISHVPSIQASGVTMAAAGESATLECRVRAVPRPQVAFWRDPQGRVPVIDGPHYAIQLVADGEEGTEYTMRLTINKMSESEQGDYFCHAENALGASVRPVSVRLRGSAAQRNVTQCCQQENVSSACIDACGFYLDMDSIIDRAECAGDFDKLMKCAADGSDHRSCCASWGVPRSCLELCRGGVAARSCALQHAPRALACFREGGASLPGPPRGLRVAPHHTLHNAVVVSWEPPSKNPGSVELYRVFWRVLGARTPDKLDTSDNSAVLAGLRDGVLYECVVKAGNHLGTSTLTEPIRFTAMGLSELAGAGTGEQASSPVSGEGSEGGSAGAAVGGALAFLLVAAVLIAAIFYYRHQRNLRLKSQGGVAFENPSYLREPNTEMPNGAADGATRSNGAAVVSSSLAWRQELTEGGAGQGAAGTEVDPSLYEGLKLGHDGAGFKRLMP